MRDPIAPKGIAADLLRTIKEVCIAKGMTPSRFGRDVLKDPSFVIDLERGGRSPTVKTIDKIYAWMDANP